MTETIVSDRIFPPVELLQEIAAELAKAAALAGDKTNANALNKAAYYIDCGILERVRDVAGDLLVPSQRAGIPTVYRVQPNWRHLCSCESRGACWHGALSEIIQVAREKEAEANDGVEAQVPEEAPALAVPICCGQPMMVDQSTYFCLDCGHWTWL